MHLPALKAAWLMMTVCSSGLATGACAQPVVRRSVVRRSVVLKPVPRTAPPMLQEASRRLAQAGVMRPDTTRRPRGRPRRDAWLAMDKAKHAGSSFLLVLGGQYVFEAKARLEHGPALALSLSTGAVVGLGKELYDRLAGPTHFFSVRDLVADTLGLLLGAGVVVL